MEDGVAVVGVECGEIVELGGELVVGAGEGSSGCGVDEEVVDGDVEGLGEGDEGVDAGGDAFVFVAADSLAVGADGFAELGLGPAVFFAEGSDAVAEGHGWSLVGGVVSVEAVVATTGVVLAVDGAGLVGSCPWCGDSEGLGVDPGANRWACTACGLSGGPIEWVMRCEGVSERHATELLREGVALTRVTEGRSPRVASVRRLPGLFDTEMSDGELVEVVAGFYHRTLATEPEAQAWLGRRRIDGNQVAEIFGVGFSNRTLGFRLPQANRVAGRVLRDRLQALGVYRRSTGHEAFRGSVTFPIRDEKGRVVQIYGRKMAGALRKGTPRHTWLAVVSWPLFNVGALERFDEVILCGSVIDALSFYAAGFTHAVAVAGSEGVDASHVEALRSHGIGRVLVAFRRNGFGDTQARRLAERLGPLGIDCLRVELPSGSDVNDYVCSVDDPRRSLGGLIRSASWIGGRARTAARPPSPLSTRMGEARSVSADGSAAGSGHVEGLSCSTAGPAPRVDVGQDLGVGVGSDDAVGSGHDQEAEAGDAVGADDPEVETEDETEAGAVGVGGVPVDAGECGPDTEAVPAGEQVGEPTGDGVLDVDADSPVSTTGPGVASDGWLVSPVPGAPSPAGEPRLDERGSLWLRFADRRWRVRGLERNTGFDVLRVQVMVTRTRPDDSAGTGRGVGGMGAGFHMDSFDLCVARARAGFCKEAAGELGVEESELRRDLGSVLAAAESCVEDAIRQAEQPVDTRVRLDADERAAALELLQDPGLVGRIVQDFSRVGMVGETTNCLLGYLATISRKLAKPLGVVIQSTSAAGKSALMDAVLEFTPEEERVSYSAMTGQSLYYMADGDLAHKVLAVAEEEGAERAAYALKLLQSEGELSIASTGKDAASGRLVTHNYTVKGPAAILLTTTAIDIDEELLNRCVVLSVDEDRAQTRAIHARQRHARTLDGLLGNAGRDAIVKAHRDAQRLLEPVAVVNPFADRLGFLDTVTRTRRDHVKYLTLISAITLLHQYQRERRSVTAADGSEVVYIETTLADIEVANRLAHEVLGRSLDELPPQTRRVLGVIDRLVGELAAVDGLERDRVRFTRRQVRGACGLSDTQCRKHLERLVELEYVLVHKGGKGSSFVYELVFTGNLDADSPRLAGLVDVEALAGVGPDVPEPVSGSAAAAVAGGAVADTAMTTESGHDSGNLAPFEADLAPGWPPNSPPVAPSWPPGLETANSQVTAPEPVVENPKSSETARLGAPGGLPDEQAAIATPADDDSGDRVEQGEGGGVSVRAGVPAGGGGR